MHSYIRLDDGGYSVGVWLRDSERGSHFERLFDVADFISACRAVGMLNGGGQPFWNEIKITKEH